MKYLIRIRHQFLDKDLTIDEMFKYERHIGNFIIANSVVYMYKAFTGDSYGISYLISSQDRPLEDLKI
jgi:uncharacterized membrane protein